MPLGESFLSTLRSNKAIMLDKTKRFRKTKGTFGDITKKIEFNYHNATPEELDGFADRLKKRNRIKWVKILLITTVLLTLITVLLFNYLGF